MYLHDWLLVAESQGCSKENIDVPKNLLVFGFYCELKKSNLTLSVTCQSLGFDPDSSIMTLELTERKEKKKIKCVLDLVLKLKDIKTCAIREFVQFIGDLTAACPTVDNGWFYSKPFERERYLALLRSKGN